MIEEGGKEVTLQDRTKVAKLFCSINEALDQIFIFFLFYWLLLQALYGVDLAIITPAQPQINVKINPCTQKNPY